jgi:hypothetical protein
MDVLGFIVECLLLGLGVYLYLFARGIISIKDPERAAKAEAFRRDNAGWMRLLGLALAAVMLLNVMLHLSQWLGG